MRKPNRREVARFLAMPLTLGSLSLVILVIVSFYASVGSSSRSPELNAGNLVRYDVKETDKANDQNIDVKTIVILPAWGVLTFIGLLLSASALAWTRRFRRRVEPGRCSACQYDLTGNMSGACPECGKPIKDVQSTIA